MTAETSTINHDINCRVCEYNLRGLSEDGNCPECGKSIEWSLCGDLLKYADMEWLHTVKIGIGCMIGGVILKTIMALVFGVVIASAGVDSEAVFGYGYAFISLLFVYGVWRVTEPESPHTPSNSIGARQVARWCIVGEWVLFVGYTTLVMVWLDDELMMLALLALLCVLIGIGYVGLFIYATALAFRAPSPRIARWTMIIMSVSIVYSLGIVASPVAEYIIFPNGPNPGSVINLAAVVIGCLVILAYPALLMASFVLLVIYDNIFETAIQDSPAVSE